MENEVLKRIGGWNTDETDFLKGHYCSKAIYYFRQFLSLVNEVKNLVLLFYGAYFLFTLPSEWWWIGIIFGIIPFGIWIGWIYVHKFMRALDYYATQYATYWSRYGFTLQEKILKELECLNKGRDNIHK